MIPQELILIKNWMYCNETNNAPANAEGKICSYTDRNNWIEYSNKTKIFVLDNNYTVIDFDMCLDESGNIYDWAKEFISPFINQGFYVEYSRSKRGLHIFAKGSSSGNISIKMTEIHKKNQDLHKKSGIEIFTKHAITVTGNVYKDNIPATIAGINENFNILYKHLLEMKQRNTKKMDIYNNSNDLFNFVKSSISLNQVFDYYGIQYNPRKNINCPLPGHTDKKPSFHIDSNLDLFVCYSGCGGGTVIDFVMKMENVNSLEAAKLLADRFHLEITINENIKREKFKPVDNVDKPVDNLDLKPVKWNPDYTFVKYKDPIGENNKKITQRLSEYFEEFPNKTGPEIEQVIPLCVTENVTCLLKHYSLIIKYNIIKSSFDVFINNVLSRYNLENNSVEIRDMCEKQNLKITKEKLNDILVKIGLDNEYNPVEDYLKESYNYYLKNPDKDIFTKLMGTLESASIWKNKFIGKFLLQMICLAISKDSSQDSADYMLVLQGPQFIGKTTWLRNLLPEKFRAKYFLGGRTLDPTNKDDRIETTTNWLVEMGEISATFRKADQEALKNFITDYKDKFRLPYAKEAIEKKRRTSLCGSTNDIEYLKDLTGTRRFLTLNCTKFKKGVSIDIDMLWGYMYKLYLQGVSYKFTNEEVDEIMSYNEQFINKPEKLLIIEDRWNLNPDTGSGKWLTASEIFAELPQQLLLNKFTIGRELKKTKIKFKKDKNLNMDVFFVAKKYTQNTTNIYSVESEFPF
jgi:putative DNA primase/helicase